MPSNTWFCGPARDNPSGIVPAFQLPSFLAASSAHSEDWLQAMPILSRGLRLDDEAAAMRLYIKLL